MDSTRQDARPVPAARALAGGVLMGLANLVPGISGGTMILAVGLYDRFVAGVAELTRLRLRRDTLVFLAIVGAGLVLAVVTFSGVAVGLVAEHRWVMYSLFIGLTLGGVPVLAPQCRPASPGVVVAALAGVAAMGALARGLASVQLQGTLPVLFVVGAIAAATMILPGVSGSYVLLILGVYDLIVGSLSFSALRRDFAASAAVFGPVVLGAGAGIALLSNLIEWLLARFSALSHAVLLGLLCGSVLGLWPFREPAHPDLAAEHAREAAAMALAGTPFEEIREAFGAEFDDARIDALRASYAGRSPSELKQLEQAQVSFRPAAGQVGASLLLLAAGFLATRSLARRRPQKEKPSTTAPCT